MKTPGGQIVQKFDLAPAGKYGDVVNLLEWSAMKDVDDYDEILNTIRSKLENFEFGDGDYLLPTGDPTAMMMVAAVACQLNGA